MSNQISTLGFAGDANTLAGYMLRANDRLGNFDLAIENTGANALYLQLKEQTNTSGAFVAIGPALSIVPKGIKTISVNLMSKKVGFFGSGYTTANVTVTMRNPGALHGGSFDLIAVGKRGWGYDAGASPADKAPPYTPFDNLI